MTREVPLRHTPLHSRYSALGATLAPFGGWEMPLWFKAGAVKEHLSVIQAAGLFDTSHMDVLTVTGEGAKAFLNYAFSHDVTDARPGVCCYGAFLNAGGGCIDDAIVYPLADCRYALVVNASMAGVIRGHLASLPDAAAVTVEEPAARYGKLDVQGPQAARLVAGLLDNAAEVFARFPYFTFKGDFDLSRSDMRLHDGTPIVLSRTGYTGEQGFELFLPADKTPEVWGLLLEAGTPLGLLPCGLAARDSLRTGAVLPLSHQDIGPAWPFINHPWPFALPYGPDGLFTKQFHGSDALNSHTAPHTLAFIGRDPRRVDGHGAKVLLDGRDIGTVTTIVTDTALGRIDGRAVSLSSPGKPDGWAPRGVCCGFIRVTENLPAGTEVTLQDERRSITVEITQDIRPDRMARKKLPTLQ